MSFADREVRTLASFDNGDLSKLKTIALDHSAISASNYSLRENFAYLIIYDSLDAERPLDGRISAKWLYPKGQSFSFACCLFIWLLLICSIHGRVAAWPKLRTELPKAPRLERRHI